MPSWRRPARRASPRLPAVAAALPRAHRPARPRCSTATPPSSPPGEVLVVGRSASGVQIADELQRSGRGGDRSPSASTSGCPARTGAATSTGGWTPSASSTSATTRWTTSTAPGGCRRCSSSGSPERRTLDLNALTAVGVGSSAGWRRSSGRHGAVLGAAGEPRGATPTSSRTACWTASTSSPPTRASTASSAPRRAPTPTRLGPVPTELDLARFDDGDLGDRLPARRSRGWTRRRSTGAAGCATTAACGALPACTCSACRSCGAASRASSTASAPTPSTWPGTSTPTWAAARA